MIEEKAPKYTMIVVHVGLIVISLTFWSTVVTCHEYRNYPIQVHQMFKEKLQNSLMGNDREKGSWGGWAPWSDCSRSCGTGVQSQARECLPKRGYLRKRSIVNVEEDKPEIKPFCIGTYKRYHVCNTQECPNFGDLRAEQCAKYNGKFYKGQNYEWEPFPDAPNDCALNCRAVGERFYATLEPEVLDGTPCRGISTHGRTRVPAGGVLAVGNADRWLCIAGQCKSVGCDGVIGSGRVLDACGVCGGEGNSCRLFEGIFLEGQSEKGYQLVTTIPKGAVSLNISELRQSVNALAIRYSNSSFLLNGDPSSRSPSGVYRGVGTSFTYRRGGDSIHAENIWAEGPLSEPVDLMILSEELNPGILYKFMLPLNEKIDDSAMIAPPLLVAGPNDKIGNEIPEESGQLTMPKKQRIKERESSGVKRRDDNNIGITNMAGDQPMQPIQSITKERKRKKNNNINNNNNRKFFWKISGLSPCSKACGGGVQYATFKCFRENTQAIAPERRCRRVPRPPSPPPLRCNSRPCPARWRAGQWSPCSVTCGFGTQTRKLECVQELNAKLTMRVASGACIEKSDLKTTMQCRQASCTFSRVPEARLIQSQLEPTFDEPRWTTSPWGTCSSTCGSGIRKRQVTCITSGSNTCSSETKPSNETICEDLPECKNTSELKAAPWLYTDWSSQCSAECGIGLQTRQIACNDGNEVFCDATKKPALEKNCTGNGIDCDRIRYQWFVGAWSPCTVSCGSGVQRRDVVCLGSLTGELKISDVKECSELTRPIAEERCLRPPCPAEWFTSDWSECPKQCNSSLQSQRVVRCLREGVESSGCSQSVEPKGRKICGKESCESEPEIIRSPMKPPKKVHEKTDCVDKYPNCNLVVKAGLCRINYYKHSCCSCRV